MRETTLTDFLEKHDSIVRRAFDAAEVFYQPRLPWRAGNPDPEEQAIQPDVILRKTDGTWVIVEFKLPLLDKRSLTKGSHARRRFIDSVGEGVAQLFNYQHYFAHQENRKAALRDLGAEVIRPELVLVIGSAENVDGVAVSEAQRQNLPFTLVDYDSLVRLYLGPDFVES